MQDDPYLQLQEVGRCRLISRAGEGGMGVVYRAHHEDLDIDVAVKFMHSNLLQRPESAQRFLQEARLAARLNHAGLVRVFDCGCKLGYYFIVMEFVEGQDLRQCIASGRTLTLSQVLRIARTVAETLNEAMKQIGIIHRDVKPANLIWSSQGEVKLADLGLAKIIAEHTVQATSLTTLPGMVLGTPQFMSPEQFSDAGHVDHRADMFSLGATLYFLLAKRPPFASDSLPELRKRIEHDTPDPLPRHVPLFVEEIVFRMMAKEADQRYSTYEELMAALVDAQERMSTYATVACGVNEFPQPTLVPALKPSARKLRPATPAEDRALLIVDIQNDFCPGGPLGVPRGDEVIPVINELSQRFAHVIVTQDWHRRDHLSFASSHPGRRVYDQIRLFYGDQILWPDHCIQGTPGAALHADLNIEQCELILRKGYIREIDSYSAFFENDRQTPTGLTGYLRERGLTHIFLCGLATDFCVAYTALDARSLGFEVTVIERACRGIDLNGSLDAAWRDMLAVGVVRA